MDLPPLPQPTDGSGVWPDHLHQAHDTLFHIYRHASQALQTCSELHRICFHAEAISNNAIPLLRALENSSAVVGVPMSWVLQVTAKFGMLLRQLQQAETTARGGETSNISVPQPITVAHTGKPGRPRKVPNVQLLHEFASPGRHLQQTKLARVMGIHRNTLRSYLKQNNVSYKYSLISDADLDQAVREFRQMKPNSGVRYLTGHLRQLGLRIQQQRVISSIHRVDPLGTVLRQRTMIQRRQYKVSRPNALWHMDGHHKLIRWGIVIHGIIDGYCRTIVAIHPSTSNSASTVLRVFLNAVAIYGTPSRIRGDRGGENKKVSVYMIMTRGPNRASFMWGSSTHNSRIERSWVEVGTQFARMWRAFFYRLERLHDLDVSNAQHLWLLHELFLEEIESDCRSFQAEWNAHPISGEGHDQSPNDMRLMGQLEHGLYADDCEGIHPDIIRQYYGTAGKPMHRAPHQTGAGHPSDEVYSASGSTDGESDDEESEEEWEDIDDFEDPGVETEDLQELPQLIAADHDSHFHHKPVRVPKHASPFNSATLHNTFHQAFTQVREAGHIPEGFGVLPHEWDGDEYPSHEIIRSGRQGTKELRIPLPDFIWRPRAIKWCQALDVMFRLLELANTDVGSSSDTDSNTDSVGHHNGSDS